LEVSDLDLLRQALGGKGDAFHLLMDRHAQAIYRLASSLVPTHHDAEDVVQETFIAAYRALKTFQERSSVKTWLYAIAYRQAALLRRKQRNPIRMLTDETPIPDRSATESTPHSAVDARLDLATALAHLPEDHRAILILRELDGLSYDEIANVLGLPRGTVESRLSRARQSLKNFFSPP
jgi:RNA polymerase sigma-70 factor, ECF subfamily